MHHRGQLSELSCDQHDYGIRQIILDKTSFFEKACSYFMARFIRRSISDSRTFPTRMEGTDIGAPPAPAPPAAPPAFVLAKCKSSRGGGDGGASAAFAFDFGAPDSPSSAEAAPSVGDGSISRVCKFQGQNFERARGRHSVTVVAFGVTSLWRWPRFFSLESEVRPAAEKRCCISKNLPGGNCNG
jgi:hypothetical protein